MNLLRSLWSLHSLANYLLEKKLVASILSRINDPARGYSAAFFIRGIFRPCRSHLGGTHGAQSGVLKSLVHLLYKTMCHRGERAGEEAGQACDREGNCARHYCGFVVELGLC